MAAGKHGSSEITITIDDAPGGTPRAITNHILTMSGAKIEALLQASHTFGDVWEEHTPTAFRKASPMTFTGFFDNTATTGPHTVLRVTDADASATAATRTLTIVFGDGVTFTCECYLVSYEIIGKNGNLTEFAVTLQPSGVATWS
jgi:hypothetical protein